MPGAVYNTLYLERASTPVNEIIRIWYIGGDIFFNISVYFLVYWNCFQSYCGYIQKVIKGRWMKTNYINIKQINKSKPMRAVKI